MAKTKTRAKKKAHFPDMHARLGRGEFIEFVSGDGWADVVLTGGGYGFTFSAYRLSEEEDRRDTLRNLAVVKQYLTALEDWLHANPAD